MVKKYCVAIFGGAVAGSEAVEQMVKKGVHVVVFDQNALPYGKIESGLPKWHVKLRDKQEQKIDARLDHPMVQYVPLCRLGRDIDFEEIAKEWGFSAILLATGAWKDRTFPLPEIEAFIGKGFYYQNPFVQWFNWFHDPNYSGPDYSVKEGAVVIGGGLASIDVAKIVMIETFRAAINKIGLKMDSISIERFGLKKAASQLGISLEQLNLKNCKIIYRRRIIDMPLSPDPVTDSLAELEKSRSVRKKIVSLAEEKFLFKVIECQSPKDIIQKEGKITGLLMQKNKIENNRAVPIENEIYELETPLVISSIGSVPEEIPGINSDGEKFVLEDQASGKLKGFENVFVLGNAITGKGNIKESQKHGRNVSESIIRDYLGVYGEDDHKSDYEFKTGIAEQLQPVTSFLTQSEPIAAKQLGQIQSRVKDLQLKQNYTNYPTWIKAHLPLRLEKMDDEEK
jgi:ferredoxin/flavodoxin---NADP+ reductase